MSTPEDQIDTGQSPGVLSLLQAPSQSPEGRAWGSQYLKAHPGGIDTSGEQSLLEDSAANAQEAREALRQARARLMAQAVPSEEETRAQMMAGNMAHDPINSPSGTVGRDLASRVAALQARRQAEQNATLQGAGLQEQMSAADQQVLKARLALQELKERGQLGLMNTALRATAKPAGPQGPESPIGKLVEDKLGPGALRTTEGQKLFDAYQAQSHEAKTPAGGAVDATAIDFGAYKLYKTGQMPALGMGAGPARSAILAGAAHLAQREAGGEDVSNPGYDQAIVNGQDFTAGQRALGSFAGGPLGNQTRALNNAVGHLKLFEDTFTALHNGDVQALNRLGNAWNKEVGKPAPVTLNAMGTIIGPELTKILANTNAGTGEERGQFLQTAGNLANSPDQIASALGAMRGMLGRQGADLALQYHGATGRSDFAKRYLSPDVAESLHLNPDTAAQQSEGSLVVIKSDEDYNNLPSGALFVGPDGHTRKKP